MSSETKERIQTLTRTSKEIYKESLRYFYNFCDRYGIIIAHLLFAAVFIYLGLQKPLPVPTPVDDKLALLGANIGLNSSLIIYFVGLYEIFVGLLFLFRLTKYVAWFFMVHQLTTLISLLVLYKEVFQPPWITIFSLDVPVFVSAYSAYVMKNLIFIACFMLLFKAKFGEEDFA